MKDKKAVYEELVRQRKACDLCQACNGRMLHNPSRIKDGKYDKHNHIGPWSAWKGDLNAQIVVVGKDWYSVKSFIEQEGVSDPDSTTNKNLITLLESIGVDPQKDKLFFTNAVLCLKDGPNDAPLIRKWLKNCASRFLRPLLDLIEPKIVITLGDDALYAVTHAYNVKGIERVSDVIEQKEPIYLTENMKWFPVYHCGRQGVNSKGGLGAHIKHWARIRPYLPK